MDGTLSPALAAVAGGAVGITVFLTVLWEALAPQRARSGLELRRWLNNGGLAVVNIVLTRLLAPVIAVSTAFLAERYGLGLLNGVELGFWPSFVVAFVLLDFAAWFFHWLSHKVPLFWWIHALHHTDLGLDFSTSYRHHPFDALYSAAQAIITVGLLGPSPLAVAVYSAVVGVWTIVRHGNVRLPEFMERALRYILVTPAMHSVHHSPRQPETDSNYGVMFPWWDRLFGTYVQKTPAERRVQPMGLETFRDPADIYLHRMMLVPFILARRRRQKRHKRIAPALSGR